MTILQQQLKIQRHSKKRQLPSYKTPNRVCLKTDGTTGQGGASLPQLAAISSPWWQDGADDGTAIIANWWKRSCRYDGTDENASIHCL